MGDEINFETTREELGLIVKICERAERRGIAAKSDRMRSVMDLSATNANGNPMDFSRMLEADDFNFSHDFLGIARHIDRDTGRLMDHFSPRFSKREG